MWYKNKLIFVYLQGDGNIRYFEIAPEETSVFFLNSYLSSMPQRGLGKLIC